MAIKLSAIQLMNNTQPKAFVTLESLQTGERINHFDLVTSFSEYIRSREFARAFKVVGDIIVPTLQGDEIVMAVFTVKSFKEEFK